MTSALPFSSRHRSGHASARETPVRIGISACILGHQVRYDGGHKLDRYIRDTVGQFAEFVPVCPEIDIGLGAPRETLHLVRRMGDAEPALIAPRSGTDHSELMRRYALRKAAALEKLDLCGFIVRRGSPSCGLERVKVYPAKGSGVPRKSGRGAFTRELIRALPLLPIEEDGRLQDPALRENFFARVFAFKRLNDFFARDWELRELMSFHASEKLLLMAHSDYKPLGQLVASGSKLQRQEVQEQYTRMFLLALASPTTVGKHTNVLHHIVGYFRKNLDPPSRQEIHDQIAAYRDRLVPLIVPITLVRHHVRKLGLTYLERQSYLHPYPSVLMLRNHA